MVNRVAELKPIMVDMTDGHGQNFLKVGFLAPDGSITFIEEKVVHQRAQKWVGEQVMAKLGKKAEPSQVDGSDQA